MSLPMPKPKKSRKSLRASMSDPGLAKGADKAPAPVVEEVLADPFEDWKANATMDVNKMSLTQLKLLDFEGIRDCHDNLLRENRDFKRLWISTLTDDQLYEDRTLFCEFGQAAWKTTMKKREQWKES